MKKMWMLVGLMIFISGCYSPIEEPGTSPIDPTQRKILDQCGYSGYIINYVDEIISENCYAIKQKKFEIMDTISIKYSFEEPYDKMFTDDGKFGEDYCENIDTYGNIYCLRDNSTCLIIEGNICEIFNVTEILKGD